MSVLVDGFRHAIRCVEAVSAIQTTVSKSAISAQTESNAAVTQASVARTAVTQASVAQTGVAETDSAVTESAQATERPQSSCGSFQILGFFDFFSQSADHQSNAERQNL